MKIKILCSLVAVVLATCLMAVPAYRGWQTKIQPDGTTITIRQCGDEYYHYWLNESGQQVKQDEQGYWQVVGTAPTSQQVARRMAAKRSERQMMSPRKNYGDKQPSKLLVILVQFTDKSFKSQYNRTYFDNILNKEGGDGSHGCGSVKDYFNQSSDGRYVPTFDVIGPVTLDNNMAYYGANDANDDDVRPEYMVRDACNKADAAGCNFANYDTDGDGIVDNVYIIYAGYGEAGGGAANTIWPHSWDLKSAGITLRLDGKTIKHYACSPELSGGSGSNSDGIATFCHEFSHVIGMPDYYDTDYGTNYDNSATPGDWSLMDGGSYNGDGWYPPVYSIYDRYFMGWATPTILKDPENVTMPVGSQYARQITSDNVLAGPTKTSTVYYLENRQKTGFDRYNPGQGLLVWKVMYNSSSWNNNVLNNTAGTLRYTLLRADGKTTGISNSKDALPAGGTGITPIAGHAITGVALNTGVVTFLYNGGQQKMTVTFDGNGHGTPATASLTETTMGGGVTLPSCTPASGYTFLGWATTNSAACAQYTAGQNYKPSQNCTLYAIYEHTGYANLEYNLEGIVKVTGPDGGEFLKSGGFNATLSAANGYDALTDDNCLYEVTVNNVDKTDVYASLAAGTITISIPAANINGAVVVTAIGTKTKASNVFERVETMGDLSAGDEVIFVNEANSCAAAGIMYGTNVLDKEDQTITDHTLELPDNTNVLIYTLGGTSGQWTFSLDGGEKLSATAVKNLSFSTGTYTWTIAIASGTATITNTTSANGTLYYNSSSPRFTTYTSAQSSIQLYKRAVAGSAVAPDFSFEQAHIQMVAGETNTPQLPITNSNGVITYVSSNPAVASVDANTGAVTAIKQGTVTITATVAATKRYQTAQASYTIDVNRATATITSVDMFTVKVGKTYTLDATTNSDAAITYTLADAKLTREGNVFRGVSAGNTTVTLRTAQTDKFAAAEKVVNVTVQAVVNYTINWNDKGNITPVVYEQGESLTLPGTVPANCSSTRTFQGWTASSSYASDVAPTYITLGEAVSANATYYAVFASMEEGASIATTVHQDSYSETCGDIDGNISYSSAKGDAATNPFVTSNNTLRIYQNGGIFTVNAKNGRKMTDVVIGSAQGTTIDVTVDGSEYVSDQAISQNGTYTLSGVEASEVSFICKGTTKTQRLEVNLLAVTYQGAGASQKYGYSLSCDAPGKSDPSCSFAESSKTMTVGEQQTQVVTTTSSGSVTYSKTGDAVDVNATTGEVTAIKQGSATITVTVAATARHNEAHASYTVNVNRATGTITASDINLTVGQNKSIAATTNTGASITYTSSNTSIATVTSEGVVTGVSQGSATITLSTVQTDTHTAANKVIQVVVNAAAVTPTMTFPDGNQSVSYGTPLTKAVTTNSDGVVSYSSGNTSVAEVDEHTGEITIKSVGNATITANVTATDNYTAHSASYTLTVTKAANSIRFAHASETVQVGSFVTNTATSNFGTVVYTSDDTYTATVNSSTGSVKGVAAGTAHITATVTGNANFDGASDSYTITVTGASGIDMQAHVASQEGRSAYSNYVTRQSSYYTGSYTYSTMMSQSGSALFGTLNTLMGNTKQPGGTYDDLRNAYVNVDKDLNRDGYIIGFYDGQSMNGTWDGGSTYNREHTWPQSKGASKTIPMGADMQSVRPASASVNSSRGNTAYGEGGIYYNPDDEIAINNSNYKAANRGTYRGDAARVILYDYIVYGEMGGHKNTYYNGNAQLLSKLGTSGVFESLNILLKWHMQDPPSLTEMVRNDGAQDYKGNRNPFIDYPELAILMLKDAEDVTTYTVTNSTPCTMTPNYTYTTTGGFATYLYNLDGTTHPGEVNVTGGTKELYNASTGLLVVSAASGNVVITSSEVTPVTTYTIAAVPNDEDYGSVTGGGVYNEDAVISLTATPKSGYVFSQWQDGSHINPRSITVTGNATYTATFVAEDTPEPEGDITVTWVLNGETFATQHYFTGDVLVVPSPAPADGGTTATPKYFVGWSEEAHWFSAINRTPDDLFTTGGQTVTRDVTYYAIYSPVR